MPESYFPAARRGELARGRSERRRTEAKRLGAQGVALGATGVGVGATASRVLGKPLIRGKPLGTRSAIGVGLASGATSVGTGVYARWKKDEITGIGQELGRGNAGHVRKSTVLRIPRSELDLFVAATLQVSGIPDLSRKERRQMILQTYRAGLANPQLLGIAKAEHHLPKRKVRTPEEIRERQRREAQIGLASNYIGLAAGATGTYTAGRDLAAARREKAGKPPKPPKPGRLARATSHLKTKHAVGLAAAGLGLQVANVGGDVVANRVLGRSAKENTVKKNEMSTTGVFERVSKRADGEGRNLLEEEIEKRERRYDPEADRQRRLGTYAGAGIGGAGILGTAGVVTLRGAEEGTKRTVKVPKFKPNRKGYLLAAGGAASGLGGLAAYKRGISERNRPWN